MKTLKKKTTPTPTPTPMKGTPKNPTYMETAEIKNPR